MQVPEKESGVSFPRLVSVDYRVDVTITTSEMDRVLKPTVLMRTVDSNGDIRTMEMNPEQFHKLRYSVARVLKVSNLIELISLNSSHRSFKRSKILPSLRSTRSRTTEIVPSGNPFQCF